MVVLVVLVVMKIVLVIPVRASAEECGGGRSAGGAGKLMVK
jgi:hypothetical protein